MAERLSTQLIDYFHRRGFDSKRLHTLGRTEIPDLVLRNRFVDLFTRPMDQRAAFLGRAEIRRDPTILFAGAPGGTFYNRMEFVVPDGGTLRRLPDERLELTTSKVKVRIGIQFDHMNASLPKGFQENYLRLSGPSAGRYDAYEVIAHVEVQFTIWSLLSERGADYYRWLDSYLDDLKNQMENERFFARINWETAETVIETQRSSAPLPPATMPK